MKVKGTPPTERQLRDDCGIPPTARFNGWAVHTPNEGGFLVAQAQVGDALVRRFGGSPEAAMLFPTANAAAEVAADLSYAAVVVAIFDLGSQLAVIQVAGNDYSDFGA